MDVKTAVVRHYSLRARILFRVLELLAYPLTLTVRRRRGDSPVRKILIVEPFNLGDVVSLSAMLDPLRERFPQAEIHLLVKHYGVDLYGNDPRVARIFEANFSWTGQKGPSCLGVAGFLRLVRDLRREQYDIGVDTRGEVRTQALLLFAGCRTRVGHLNYMASDAVLKGLLLTANAGLLPAMPRADMNLAAIALLGCDTAGRRPRLHVQEASPRSHHRFTVAIHTGSGWVYKLWQEGNWIDLINSLVSEFDVAIEVIGSPAERARIERIQSRVSSSVEFRVTSSVQQLIIRLCACDMAICLDSGPMHIASALNKPVLALFGCGAVDIWRPTSEGSQVIHHQVEFPCAPCLSIDCKHKGANCVDAITVQEVLDAFRRMVPSRTW